MQEQNYPFPALTTEQLSNSLGSCSINDNFLTAPMGSHFNPVSRTMTPQGLHYVMHGGDFPAEGGDTQRRLAIFQNLTQGDDGRT